MSDIRNDVRDLVLEFFQMTGLDILPHDGVYSVAIPEKHRGFFQADKISIAFDKETSAKHGCELVAPGSKLLAKIIGACTTKGPITLKRYALGRRSLIRYHFFIHFSGLSSTSFLDHVDVELDPPSSSEMTATNPGHASGTLRWMDPEAVTSTYSTALDELQKRHIDDKKIFLDGADQTFGEAVELLVTQHDTRMRELDDSIRKREAGSDDFDKVQEFRFETVERIRDMEKAQPLLLEALQQKHRVMLEYRLVACEVL